MKTVTCSEPSSLTHWTRRHFLLALGGTALAPALFREARARSADRDRRIVLSGPGSRYVPRIHAAFVRRQGDYGILWPGAIYDGEKAAREYRRQILEAEKELGLKITLRPAPIHSLAEADAWLAEAKADKPDGLLVVVMDRQQHAWPTATKAIESGVRGRSRRRPHPCAGATALRPARFPAGSGGRDGARMPDRRALLVPDAAARV